MKKIGFTLLELLIVIIIVGILAAVAVVSYSRTAEKSRTSEAKANLGTLRTLQMAYYQETGNYTSNLTILGAGDLPWHDPYVCPIICSDVNHYFTYWCDTRGTCGACRCGAGGKNPPYSPGYSIELDINGTWSGTPGWY